MAENDRRQRLCDGSRIGKDLQRQSIRRPPRRQTHPTDALHGASSKAMLSLDIQGASRVARHAPGIGSSNKGRSATRANILKLLAHWWRTHVSLLPPACDEFTTKRALLQCPRASAAGVDAPFLSVEYVDAADRYAQLDGPA